MKQLDLFQWADSRPSAEIVDLVPAIIHHICRQPYPNPIKNGELVTLPLKARVA